MGGGVGWGGWLSKTRPIPRSPDGDKNIRLEENLSYSSIVPRRENNDRRTLTLNLQLTSKCDGKAATNGFPTALVLPMWSNLVQIESCQRFPTT